MQLTLVAEENDLGIIVTSSLSWVKHVNAIVSKANKLLGLLKHTCPLLLNVAVRRTLYLFPFKSQLCYRTLAYKARVNACREEPLDGYCDLTSEKCLNIRKDLLDWTCYH